MAEAGSIRGGDGTVGDEEPIKKEAQFLAPSTKLAILSAMAPTRSEAEIGDFQRLLVAAQPTRQYTVAPQLEPKYTCDICGNRDQTQFLPVAKDGDVVCLGIKDQGCGNVVEEHKMFEGNQFRKFEGPARRPFPPPRRRRDVFLRFKLDSRVRRPVTQARRTNRTTARRRTSCTRRRTT